MSTRDGRRDVRRGLVHINLARGYRGGERQTELLVRALAARGWSQTLVARAREALAGRLAGLPGLTIRVAGAAPLSAARAIGRPALIHVHEGRSLRSGWVNASFTGAPYVVTRRVQKGPGRHWLNRRMYRGAARIVALSSAIASSVRRLEADLPVEIIPSAHSGLCADPDNVARLRKRWGGDFIVGHVGALDESHKGQTRIVEAAAVLAETHPGMRFVIVGSGPDASRLAASTRGLSAVSLEGQVDNVGDYLAAFDVFVFPSNHEGLGSILLDALYFGLPIVASRVGGIPDIVEEGVNGHLVSPGDVDGLREALAGLSAAPELVDRISRANREKSAGYSADVMADRYEAVYRSVLGEDTGGAA
jgi:glycosyltransferase involved in cell wall biosynthesis